MTAFGIERDLEQDARRMADLVMGHLVPGPRFVTVTALRS